MNEKLFEVYKLNDTLILQNRIAMAPITRCFANDDLVPTEDMIKYYSSRGDLGLIITEATLISKEAQGYPNQPGIFTNEQIEAWSKVTKGVHEKGGKIFSQLFHAGRLSHSIYTNRTPLAPSSVAFDERMPRSELMYEEPKALTTNEIKRIINDFVQASKNAIEAGFDGIEFHVANGYLPDQFLHQVTNQRNDEYGGSVENRARFILEAIDKMVEAIGKNRVAIRLSPHAYLHMSYVQGDEDTFVYLLKELEKRELAYIHTGIYDDSEIVPYLNGKVSEFMRDNYRGNLIANGSYSIEQSNNAIDENKFDIIAFGRLAVANPDLVEKIKTNKSLETYDNDSLNILI